MIRRIITIDTEKCTGCALCVNACHEGAIGLRDGKAVLLREDYCDGLGDCLPACPADAIHFEEREAAAYDHEAVQKHLAARKHAAAGGCPGSAAAFFGHEHIEKPLADTVSSTSAPAVPESQLSQWPVQIKLVAPNAPYFNGCDLLIAADCTAYAYGNFHQAFIKDHITLVGCPKLDAVDYSEKLTQIFTYNDIKRITLTRMTVPCCGGMAMAVQKAIQASGKNIPLKIVIISPDGQIVQTQEV